MTLQIPSKTKVELVYSVEPDVFKPNAKLQATLTELVKREARARVERGAPLAFRLPLAGLCEMAVAPCGEALSLPRRPGSIEFVVRRKETPHSQPALVKQVEPLLLSEVTYPAPVWQERYESLVGLNGIKRRVLTMLNLLFSDRLMTAWSQKHHRQIPPLTLLRQRYPVFVFEGHPGLGKTELACSIGDPLARVLGCEIVAYQVGLQLRGEGLVGQLSQNICKLIEFAKMRHEERSVPILLVVDEADAFGQSRETGQQHHEDSAGVNTLLQQIDSLRETPGIALLFTTNRHWALDTALKARTNAHWVRFPLPDYGVRFYLLLRLLGNALTPPERRTLAGVTGGFAPRDIVQLCEAALIEAISQDRPLTCDLLLHTASLFRQSLDQTSDGAAVNVNAHRR